MSDDLIKREDAIATIGVMYERTHDIIDYRDLMLEAIKVLPSADTDISEYSDKLWRNAYERGKADGAMIYGNEHNCIMTIFGECSYAETGCGDCAVVEKVRKALSADRPQGEWVKHDDERDYCSRCKHIFKTRTITQQDKWTLYIDDLGYNYCPNCGAQMKGADDEV